jgi:hypothetical protein
VLAYKKTSATRGYGIRLSSRFRLADLTHSDTARSRGLSNAPRFSDLNRLKKVARMLDAVERRLGRPLRISSGYRGEALNQLVGGVPLSQHRTGQAVDFSCPGFGSPLATARAITRSGIVFDQLIYEFGCRPDGGWIHLSWSARPRRRTLTICSGQRGYRSGLHPCHCAG